MSERLEIDADRYVARRSLPGAAMAPIAMAAMLLESGRGSHFWTIGLATTLVALAVVAPRVWLARRAQAATDATWRWSFAIATFAGYAALSAFVAFGILLVGDLMAAVMTFAASTFIAGSSNVFAARKRLMFAIACVLVVPPLLAIGTKEPWLRNVLGLLLVIPSTYYLVSAVRTHDEYWQRAHAQEKLAQRNTELRLLLDNVGQAFLTVDRDGVLAAERSAMVDRWFGSYTDRPRFADYIAATDRLFGEEFALAHEALLEDFLPREVCLAQLPRRIQKGSQEFQCSYVPLPSENGDDAGLLLVIDDVTQDAKRRADELVQKELLAMAQGMMTDRAGYLAFFHEGQDLVAELDASLHDAVACTRALHTLKGNASTVGAEALAARCHAAEQEIEQGELSAKMLAPVRERWDALATAISSLVGKGSEDVVELLPASIDALRNDVLAGTPRRVIASNLARLKLEPVERPLQRLAAHAVPLAERLGKGALATEISAPELRLDPKVWNRLWAVLVHVVRNAVDHGLESPEARLASGKPATPKLTLSARADGDRLVIEIKDDGRGIDWDLVREKAKAQKRPIASAEDLVDVLLDAGFSTREVVTPISGRGVGMSAVAEEVRRLGGRIHVESAHGIGTCWSFSLPLGRSTLENDAGVFSCPPLSNAS